MIGVAILRKAEALTKTASGLRNVNAAAADK